MIGKNDNGQERRKNLLLRNKIQILIQCVSNNQQVTQRRMTSKLIASLFLILFMTIQINCQCDYLRSTKLLVNSKVGKLTLTNQYLAEGRIQNTFQPTLVPKGALGQGYYTNQAGTSTGTRGYTSLKINDQNKTLVILHQQLWDDTQRAVISAMCIQDGVEKLSVNDVAYYELIYKLMDTKQSLGYTTSKNLYCTFNDFQEEEITSLKLTGAGHSASLQGQLITEPSTQYELEECKYMQLLVTLES